MRKFLKFSLVYAVAGLAAGVFFREYTHFREWTTPTTLSAVHPHLLVLGMLGFLIFALFEKHIHFSSSRFFRPFLLFYNSGLVLTAIMLLVRGIWQIESLENSAAISGIAGVGHILLAIGILLLFASFFNVLSSVERKEDIPHVSK